MSAGTSSGFVVFSRDLPAIWDSLLIFLAVRYLSSSTYLCFDVRIFQAMQASFLAAEIVALQDPNVKERLEKMREAWR